MADPLSDKVKSKRTGRTRRLTGWTLIALGLLVAGAWGASRWWMVSYSTSRTSCFVQAGLFVVGDRIQVEPGWSTLWRGDRSPPLYWRAKNGPTRPDDAGWDGLIVGRTKLITNFVAIDTWSVAFWPIPLLLWAAGVPVLRSGILARRRAMTGSCGKCGYSLAGLGVGAKCPECGGGGGGGKGAGTT